MDDLEYNVSSRKTVYDPATALACFETQGEACSLAEGDAFFAEREQSDFMYLLLEGEVRLFRGVRVLDIVRSGEIFGEMAVITGQPRSAWAVAREPCKALTLDPIQFLEAICTTPEFVLMLMRIMFERLRLTSEFLNKTGRLRNSGKVHEKVFSKSLVRQLASAMGVSEPETIRPTTVILREGESDSSMYVVVSGEIAVSIQGTYVERVGTGGILGEIALVNDSPRAASAIALSEVQLLTINRDDFMGLVKTNPSFAVSLLRAVATRLEIQTAKSAFMDR
jgi:CRP/FNR family cyclic AMP-dependent transcriptional regulator